MVRRRETITLIETGPDVWDLYALRNRRAKKPSYYCTIVKRVTGYAVVYHQRKWPPKKHNFWQFIRNNEVRNMEEIADYAYDIAVDQHVYFGRLQRSGAKPKQMRSLYV